MTFSQLTEPELNLRVQIAQIVPATRAEGAGLRFAIWFQGCPFRCPGCCNPEMLSFAGGRHTTVGEVLDQIERAAQSEPALEGITLLGGEPFAHVQAAGMIARGAQALQLSVMVFSGYRLEELRQREEMADLLSQTDLLVDGLYQQDRPDTDRRWIGSTNQEVHFLTERYSPDDPCWKERDTLEIRLENQNITINGFPARTAVGLWKRLLDPEPRS